MTPLRIAVVGVGALGRHHARILAGMDGVDLVAVCDPNEAQGRAVADACNSEWVADYTSIIDSIDAVSIAAPTKFHIGIASDFLSAGIPTLVEKPLTDSTETARTLVRLAEQQDVPLQVGHVERFNPATQTAWELIDSPKYIRAERLSPYTFRSTDIGVVHDIMIHDIDLVLSLVDSRVRSVDAFGVSVFGGNEDTAQARITFENGCIADLTASRVNPTPARKTLLWSADRCVSVDYGSREVTSHRVSDAVHFGTPVYRRATEPGADVSQLKEQVFTDFIRIEGHEVSDADALTAELSHFVECARTGATPSCSGRDGLAALELAEQVLDSIAAHQWDGHAAGPVGPHYETVRTLRKAG